MRGVIEGLDQRANDGKDLSIDWGEKRFDPRKVQRWWKSHGGINGVRPFSSKPSKGKYSELSSNTASRSNSIYLAAISNRGLRTTYRRKPPTKSSKSSTLHRPKEVTQPSRVTDEPKGESFSHWRFVDIPGSPLLTRMSETLKIEYESAISSLNLALSSPAESDADGSSDINQEDRMDFSTGEFTNSLVRYSREVFQTSDTISANSNPPLADLSYSEFSIRDWNWLEGQPIYGLSPYPASSESGEHGTSVYKYRWPGAQSQFLKREEAKVMSRLGKLDVDHPMTLVAKKELASIYYEQDKSEQAELLYGQIADYYEIKLGSNDVKTLSAHLDVAMILYRQAKRLQARKIHQCVHDSIIELVDRKVVDQKDDLALRSNFLRSAILHDLGQLDEAENLIQQIFQARMETLGLRHKDTLYVMKIFARTLRSRKKLVESEQLQRTNSQYYLEVEGPFSKNFLDSLHRLAAISYEQEEYDDCQRLSITVAERFRDLMGQKDRNTLYNRFMAAVCTRKLGNLAESKCQLQDILEKQIKTLGEKNPDTCDVSRELSGVLGDMGNDTEAVTLLEKSYKGLTESLGRSHTETLKCRQDLGDIYKKLGRNKDATALLQPRVDDE